MLPQALPITPADTALGFSRRCQSHSPQTPPHCLALPGGHPCIQPLKSPRPHPSLTPSPFDTSQGGGPWFKLWSQHIGQEEREEGRRDGGRDRKEGRKTCVLHLRPRCLPRGVLMPAPSNIQSRGPRSADLHRSSGASHSPTPSLAQSLSLDLSSISFREPFCHTAHSVPHPAWNDAPFQAPPPLIFSLQAHLQQPLLGDTHPCPWQSQIAFWAPPAYVSLGRVRTPGGWRYQPSPGMSLAHRGQAKFEEQTQWFAHGASRDLRIPAMPSPILGPPLALRPPGSPQRACPPPLRVIPGPSAHPGTRRDSRRTRLRGLHAPVGLGPSRTPDLPRGVPNVLGSPVPSAGP